MFVIEFIYTCIKISDYAYDHCCTYSAQLRSFHYSCCILQSYHSFQTLKWLVEDQNQAKVAHR
jgi:hypothetical protein